MFYAVVVVDEKAEHEHLASLVSGYIILQTEVTRFSGEQSGMPRCGHVNHVVARSRASALFCVRAVSAPIRAGWARVCAQVELELEPIKARSLNFDDFATPCRTRINAHERCYSGCLGRRTHKFLFSLSMLLSLNLTAISIIASLQQVVHCSSGQGVG